jgi:hypothetical protein
MIDPVELKLLVHGPVGHGKTALIGTAVNDPRLMPGLLADFEGGYRSIRSKVITVPLEELRSFGEPPLDKLVRVRLRSWRDIDEIYDVLQQNDNPYKSFFGDSLSEIHYLSLEGVISTDVRREPSKYDPDQPQQAQYLKALSQMRKFVRYFRDLEGMHTILTATTMDIEDARTRRGKAQPNLIGKFAQEVSALVDWVAYLGLSEETKNNVRTVTRTLCTGPSERYVAKGRNDVDSGGQLPEFIDEPTLPMILDFLQGKRDS